jgi:hypothetical protein
LGFGLRRKMVKIHTFITEDDVNYYRQMTDEKIKDIMNYPHGRELYGFPDGDIDVLLKEFRSDGFTKFTRRGSWRYERIPVMNNNGKVNLRTTCYAEFYYVNQWGQETRAIKYRIICDDELNVLWTGSDEKDQHFLSINKMIYKIRYGHKALVLYPNICNKTDSINKADEEQSLDDIITKYPNLHSGSVIFLGEYFGQKFFGRTMNGLLVGWIFYARRTWLY